jgi:hypothetical protein
MAQYDRTIRGVPMQEIGSPSAAGLQRLSDVDDISIGEGDGGNGAGGARAGKGNHVYRKKVGPKLTAFLLLNAMIGAGILNVPYTFKQSGIVLVRACVHRLPLILTAALICVAMW